MNPQGHQGIENAHEKKDVDVMNLGMIAALLLLTIAICFLCVLGILHFLTRERKAEEPRRAQVSGQGEAFPQPRLQVNPGFDLAESGTSDHAKLNSYGWIDRGAGIAHIPIARAMELLVERGLPEVGAGQTRLQLMQARAATNAQPNETRPEVTPK